MTGFLSDLLAGMGIGLGIILILALVLWGLSEWDKRLAVRDWRRATRMAERLMGSRYPTISRSGLDVEAAQMAEYFELSDHIRHRNKFEGRHHDAA